MTEKRPLNLSDPDLLQRKIDEMRKAKGIRVTKSNYLPSFGGTDNKYECIDGEIFINDNGVLTKYHE